jgi:hypothetical protein
MAQLHEELATLWDLWERMNSGELTVYRGGEDVTICETAILRTEIAYLENVLTRLKAPAE